MDAIQAKLASPAYAPAMTSLTEATIPSAVSLFSTYAGNDRDLAGWLKDAQINHDYDMRLQYMAGLALNQNKADLIYRQILSRATVPKNSFTGNPETLQSIFQAVSSRSGAGFTQ
jgi:spermidine synthase